jgi:hypothetical protein
MKWIDYYIPYIFKPFMVISEKQEFFTHCITPIVFLTNVTCCVLLGAHPTDLVEKLLILIEDDQASQMARLTPDDLYDRDQS